LIEGLTHSGAIPTLKRSVQFASARHEVLVNNVANLSTPNFKPKELDPAQFQGQLRAAVERRRAEPAAQGEPLELKDSRQIQFEKDKIEARPEPANENLMFHDRNNRNLERQMQHLAENTLMHESSIRLLKKEFDLLNTAIRERV